MFGIEPLPEPFQTYLLAVNLVAFIGIGVDQILAEKAKWRIDEDALIVLAFFGGTPGIYVARWIFRHEARSSEFSGKLFIAALINVGLVVLGLLMGWEELFELITEGSTGRGGMRMTAGA